MDISTIGLFAFAATPYAFKFLWSPFIDHFPFPILSRLMGRRRGWIVATQLALAASLLLLACNRPGVSPLATALCALIVAFFSASQDIVIDAYRVELLLPQEQGRGAAVAQFGYRIGMIASTAGALRLATLFGWQWTYTVMAALLGVGIVTVLLSEEGSLHETARQGGISSQLRETVIGPFLDFMRHDSWWLILLFIVVYKFADAFIGIVTNPFLLGIGFTKDDVSYIVKIYGTLATIAGTFAGGALVVRHGAVRVMFAAGLLHALTNLLYAYQAHVGNDSLVLTVSVMAENISGGVSSAAFVAFLSNLCNRHYTATQYALLSSLAAFGRTWLSAPAGIAAKHLGWEWFFVLSALLALPGLVVLWFLQKRIKT